MGDSVLFGNEVFALAKFMEKAWWDFVTHLTNSFICIPIFSFIGCVMFCFVLFFFLLSRGYREWNCGNIIDKCIDQCLISPRRAGHRSGCLTLE